MASVSLTEVWVHDADDPSDYVTSDGFGEGGPTDSVVGEVRRYAQGRRRAVRRAGRTRRYRRTFPAVSDEWIDWMDDHIGSTVMVRDPKGRLFFGVFWEIDIPDLPGGAAPDVTVAFESVTYSIEAS